MTNELRNAVSRLRKLQDAAYDGKLELPSIIIGLSYHHAEHSSGDSSSVDVDVCIHDEKCVMKKHLFFTLSEERCYEVGSEDDRDWSIDEILHEIAVTVDYPV